MLRPPYASNARPDLALAPHGPEVEAEIADLVDEIDGGRSRKRRSNASMSKREFYFRLVECEVMVRL